MIPTDSTSSILLVIPRLPALHLANTAPRLHRPNTRLVVAQNDRSAQSPPVAAESTPFAIRIAIPLYTPSPPPPSRLPGACSFRTVGREPTRGRRRLRRLQRSLCHLSRETQYNARNGSHWTPRCFLTYPPHHPAVAPHPTPSCPSLPHPGRSRPAKPQTPPRTRTPITYTARARDSLP